MGNCKDCAFWQREITKRFECKEVGHKMFGHIMENWNWSDVPYIEIEPRTECFGKCDRLTNEIEKGFGDALVMSAKHDNWEGCLTNENFGCVLFISNAKL